MLLLGVRERSSWSINKRGIDTGVYLFILSETFEVLTETSTLSQTCR